MWHLGTFAQGVKVGPGCRDYRRALTEQRDPVNCLVEEQQSENPWRQGCASMAGLSDKVETVLEDQVNRRQVIKLAETGGG